MSDIINRLRSGAPCNETWSELASCTNGERSEATAALAQAGKEQSK